MKYPQKGRGYAISAKGSAFLFSRRTCDLIPSASSG